MDFFILRLFITICFNYETLTFRLNETTAYVRLRERSENCKSVVPTTLNGSCLYNIIPYSQFKAMEATFGNITGITPTMEKAAISFSSFKPSPQRHMTPPRFPVNATSGPTFIAKTLLQKSGEDSLNGGLKVETTKKRSLSPEPDIRKRNKSVEDVPKKAAAQTFEEPPWEWIY